MKLSIKPSDRVSVMGRTGSGKTTLLKALMRFWIWQTRDWFPYHVVILDTKKDGDFDGMGKKFSRLKDLNRLWDKYRVLIYEPDETELAGGPDSEFLNGFFRFLRLSREPLLLVIDELASVAKGNNVAFEYELLMKQGRSKNQAVWAGIQNPVFVPHDFLSAANHFFVFDLNIEDDRKKVSKIVGDGVMIPPIENGGEAAEHGFYYRNIVKRELHFVVNNPPLKFPVPDDFDPKSAIGFTEEEEGGFRLMNWKWFSAVLLLALLMVLTIPLWKIFFNWLAGSVPATAPVANYVNQT